MYYQTKLSNGLKLVIIPKNNSKTITALVLLPAGSRHESLKLHGASHFIEHMMFKGTKKRPTSLAIAQELDGIGANYNAFTGKDHTGYWIKTVNNKMETALNVLSDMLFNSLFKAKEFCQEKGVILEEIKMYQENPLLYINDFFENTIYQNHPLGQLISGQLSDVKKMNRQKLLAYKKIFYQPHQMVVAISGGVDKLQVINLMKKYFAPYHGAKKQGSFKIFNRKKIKIKDKVKILFKDLKQTQIALGGLAYHYNHPKIEALKLLLVILGGNMSSRLFTEVRVKRGLAYAINADFDIYQDIGNYGIFAGVDKNKTQEAVEVILKELKKIKDKGVTKEELIRAKDYIEGSTGLYLEDSANLAGWYAKQILLTGKIFTPKEKLAKMRKVQRKDIQNVAQDIFKNINISLIGPIKDKNIFLRLLKKEI
ncbi:MAG: pitrilysin family protein [Patescibacteria group bacterium]|jgi:predicted Zn-dependent peptidase|nr:pitrilysin family protein [Patescibacteria group bacterium]MDD5172609.1 pitrilysin family protein [Patescibacteria group bacterium]